MSEYDKRVDALIHCTEFLVDQTKIVLSLKEDLEGTMFECRRDEDCDHCNLESANEFTEAAIKDLKTFARPSGEWISIENSFPEGGMHEYWVALYLNDNPDNVFCEKAVLGRVSRTWYFEDFRTGTYTVTHWQPLPSAPETK